MKKIDNVSGCGIRYGTMADTHWILIAEYGDVRISASGEKITYIGSGLVEISRGGK